MEKGDYSEVDYAVLGLARLLTQGRPLDGETSDWAIDMLVLRGYATIDPATQFEGGSKRKWRLTPVGERELKLFVETCRAAKP